MAINEEARAKTPFLSDAFTWTQTLCLVPCCVWRKVYQDNPTYYYKSVCHAFLANFCLAEGFLGEEQTHRPLYGSNLSTGPVADFAISEIPPPQQLSQVLSSVYLSAVYNDLCLCNQQLSPAYWLEHCTWENNEPTKSKCGSIFPSCFLGVVLFRGSHLASWESYCFMEAILLPWSHTVSGGHLAFWEPY